MKRLLTLVCVLVPLLAFAFEVKVHQVLPDGPIERSVELKSQLPEKVVLDCQSFINGLRIGEFENARYFMMDPNECDYLQERVKKSVREERKHCIEVDLEVENDFSC